MQTLLSTDNDTFEQLMALEFPVGLEDTLVEVVPHMGEDLLVRQRAAQFIGACVTGEQVALPESVAATQPIESLYDAISKAHEGNQVARRMVETNARTDVIERTIKAGHVIKVELDVDEAGVIRQHGQSMESVQANSLRLASDHPHMLERTKAEATNAFRIEEAYSAGKLDEHYFVVFSRAADNMSKHDMHKAGFFTDTMSCAIQVTKVENGQLTTETAFVAGVRQPGGDRHDKEAVATVAERLGKGSIYKNKDDAETIDMPLLIHKSLLPKGVLDLVAWYDEAAGDTFFGQIAPAEDYVSYAAKCREREATLQPKVAAITEELIAAAPRLSGPVEACQMLHELSERHMVEQAVFDDTINPLVFGAPAASNIEEARRQFEQGNLEAGLEFTQKAINIADSSSCPGGVKSNSNTGETGDDNSSTDSYEGNCEFVSKECPVCHKKNVKTTVTKTHIKGDCGCKVSKK